MMSNLHERTVEEVLREVIESMGEATVAAPSAAAVEALVAVASGMDDPPSVRLLATEATLKHVMDDFLVASNAADLVETGALSVRSGETTDGMLLVTDEAVVSVVDAGDRVAGLVDEDEEFVERANDRYDDAWADAEEYPLRTPALSTVRSTLEEQLGPDSAGDLDAVLRSLATVRGEDDGLDEVTISLLVAAKNEELLYDVSKWGEDVGIASKATFSRTKTSLEEMGLIDTEKVPIDIGRPRLRLLLGDDRLREADAGQLASVAGSILAS